MQNLKIQTQLLMRLDLWPLSRCKLATLPAPSVKLNRMQVLQRHPNWYATGCALMLLLKEMAILAYEFASVRIPNCLPSDLLVLCNLAHHTDLYRA